MYGELELSIVHGTLLMHIFPSLFVCCLVALQFSDSAYLLFLANWLRGFFFSQRDLKARSLHGLASPMRYDIQDL